MSRCSESRGLAGALGVAAACLVLALPTAWAATPPAKPAAANAPTTPAKTRFGFGKPATPQEIAGWDIDVRPDGTGLPAGRGTVAAGQAVYDEKCASCHGTFGESNDYMAIAGGVGTLGSDAPIRTTGSKLNHTTTLWDYINRAMPFNAPQTLTVEEVYALTAYVLHLNDLLPADGVLDRESLIAFKMPNRDGFTLEHGFRARDGKPDTRNTACMSNCAAEVRLSSEMPDHARDAHGNLAEQVRGLGPIEGAKTGTGTAAPAGAVPAAKAPDGAELVKVNGCTACHGTANKIVGPSFREIGGRYASADAAETTLAAKVQKGSAGVWGQVPMPPQPQVKEAEVKSIVRWILGGAR